MSTRTLPERREVKRALREAGLSARQVDALLRGGWAGLVGQPRAYSDELVERLERLQRMVGVATESSPE